MKDSRLATKTGRPWSHEACGVRTGALEEIRVGRFLDKSEAHELEI